jgi:hypothetical protein
LVNSGDKFEIVFDKNLFEPPTIVKTMHNKLEAIARSQEAIKAAKARGRW